MMVHMPGCNVSQSPHCKLISAGDACALPGFLRQVTEERQGCTPDLLKFLHVTRPRGLVGASGSSGNLLFKAGQRRIESAGKPESAKDKHALTVVQMAQHFANTPLSRRIMVERF